MNYIDALRRALLARISQEIIEGLEWQEEAQRVAHAQNEEYARLVTAHILRVAKTLAKTPPV